MCMQTIKRCVSSIRTLGAKRFYCSNAGREAKCNRDGFRSWRSVLKSSNSSKEITTENIESQFLNAKIGTIKSRNMCLPQLSDEIKPSIKSVTALKVDFTHVTVAQVLRHPFELCRWEQIKFDGDNKPKAVHEIFEWALTIHANLPKSDVFVVEEFSKKLKQQNAIPFLLNVTALQACLLTLLNSNFLESQQHAVFTMKPEKITKHFNIGVKNERISCIDLILQTLRKEAQHLDSKLNDLQIPLDVQSDFLVAKSPLRHHFGITLLLAVAFFDLNKL